MAIRFRKYVNKVGDEVRAIRITEKNVEELVSFISKNGQTALDETKVFYSPDLKDGQYTAVKLALVQTNVSAKTGKKSKGVRKAFGGDVIVRNEDGSFSRIKSYDFDGYKAA